MKVWYCFLLVGIIFVSQNCSNPDKVFAENFPFQKADKVVIYSKLRNDSLERMFSRGGKGLDSSSFKELKNIFFDYASIKRKENLLSKYYKTDVITDTNKILELRSFFSPEGGCSEPACIPFFRDLVAFYKNDTMFASVKICFECGMSDFDPNPKKCIQAPFSKLQEFWIKNGIKKEKDFE